ncbi:MAG: hypothetical protein LC802_07840, partial [Acidobacteria bacterium]|nr:hypothetical protein [Acidobacteriota bacterium]
MATTKKSGQSKRGARSRKAAKAGGGKKTAGAGRKGGKRRERVAGPPVAPPTDSVGAAPAAVVGSVLVWEDDPISVPARQPIQLPAPTLPTGALGIRIVD